MKLTAVVLIGLVVCALGAAREEKAKEKTVEPGSDRRGRLFFLTRLLAGSGVTSLGQTFTSLGNTLSSYGQVNKTSVKPAQRQCPLPLFTSGCLSGYVCAMAGYGNNRCVPQAPVGFPCTTGFQCIRGACRDGVCVKDDCRTVGAMSNCPRGKQCVATNKGNRCQVPSTSNACPTLLSMLGCNENQYCTRSNRGNICTAKLPVESICTDPVQCLSGNCRHRKCKADACPTIDMSIDCMPTQYCAPGANGNVCVARLMNGARCSAPRQCMSNTCEHGRCVQDDCPHAYQPGRCLPSQFCSPAPNGNMCLQKSAAGAICHNDIACMSHTCRRNRCVVNQCPTALSTDGCNMLMQFCMSGNKGNICVTKLSNGATCMVSTQCMSNNCRNGICAAAAPVLLANGAACANPVQCSSGNCVLSVCAATKMSVGGLCLAATDCQSLTCTNMRCVDGTTTTTMTTMATTTTMTTTTATTTTTTATTADSTTTTTTATTTTTSAGIGGRCTAGTDCTSGRCVLNLCVAALVTNGEACALPTDCLSNNCVGGPPGVCTLGIGIAGSACTNGLQCVTAVCKPDGLCA